MYPARLTFRLPASLTAPRGPYRPEIEGCSLNIDRASLVTIGGPSREMVQETTRGFLRVVAREIIAGRQQPESIAAVMRIRDRADGGPGQDGVQIIIGADVAFASTSLPVDLGVAS